MENICLRLEYANYYKVVEIPFRPITGDYITDCGITMDVGKIFLNTDQKETTVKVSIHNIDYPDQESLSTDMVKKGWHKKNENE